MRRPLIYIRKAPNVNATTLTGKQVHASTRRYWLPACGRYMRGIVYTAEDVNCPKCKTKEADQ